VAKARREADAMLAAEREKVADAKDDLEVVIEGELVLNSIPHIILRVTLTPKLL